nr:capsid protein [Hymenolepis microstoma]
MENPKSEELAPFPLKSSWGRSKNPSRPSSAAFSGPPKTLPKIEEPIAARDDPIWADAIFARNVAIREKSRGKFVNVNLASQATITERVADFLFAADPDLGKTLPREAFSPSSCFGTVTTSNGENFDPFFPPLPHFLVGNYGGYYDNNVYNVDNHNLYEEIPALGVVAEACRQSASDAPAGMYQPAISPDPALRANLNLLGYAPLTYRRQEAKDIFLTNGIDGDSFREDISDTAINFNLIESVSMVLRELSVFTMAEINFPSMPPEGNRCMLLPSNPSDLWNPVGVAYTNANFITHSLCRDTPATFGVASVMLLQLFKEPRPDGPSPNNAWLGFDYTDEVPPPQAMIDNRNNRRRQQDDPHGLPQRFNERVFSCCSMNARQRRTLFLESLKKR